MTARIAVLGIVLTALIAGAALYYLQVYAYYHDVEATGDDVQMVSMITGQPEPILYDNFKAIDSESSPVRYRACFTTSMSFGTLTETYEIDDDAEPLNAPAWFDCFNAQTIGADLESGVAVAFLGTKDVHYGIDRVIAVYPDGRAYAWQQINACGAVVFDGNPAPEGCPPSPESVN